MIELSENEVLNDLLGYENMKIIQRNDMLNFSLDSVLIAHFATIPAKAKSIFEFGTGNAPIPLFLSTRTACNITALELQKEAVELAKRNIALNNLEQQVTIEQCDIKEIKQHFASQEADVVISNPPFFKTTERRQMNECAALTIARHEVALNLEQLIQSASFILNNNGYFAMVHRPDRLIEIINTLQKYNLEPKRVQFVYPKEGQDAHMLLIESRKNGNPGLKILPPLIIHEADGSYREPILKLFQRI